MLGLIRRYLQAGMRWDDLVSQRSQGTPQGAPLSPLLSHVPLDELDKDLERRGHRFARDADDCTIYVQSRRAGERVLTSIERFWADRLRLGVNGKKRAVAPPWQHQFLGYTFTMHHQPKFKVALESLKRFKRRLRQKLRQGRGRHLGRVSMALRPMLRGWVSSVRKSQVRITFEALDQWRRRKRRAILWRQWKRPQTRAKNLMQRGLPRKRVWPSAMHGRGP